MIISFQGEYRWLSNFSPCLVVLDGETYASTEHAYQAAKTLNLDQRKQIMRMAHASAAKRAGRYVAMRLDWDTVKISVMRNLLQQKFAQTPYRELLLATGNHLIIEGNTWGDVFWGVCLGVGENNLGKLIMEIRASL